MTVMQAEVCTNNYREETPQVKSVYEDTFQHDKWRIQSYILPPTNPKPASPSADSREPSTTVPKRDVRKIGVTPIS